MTHVRKSRRITLSEGARLDDWEAFFRAKSARRARSHTRERAMKAGALSLFLGGLIAGAYVLVFGIPQ